jgi:putative membrane protein
MRLLVAALLFAPGFALSACAAAPVNEKAEVQTDRFEDKIAMGDLFEIESSRLALQRSTSPRVRAFAQRTIDERGVASTQLLVPVAQAGLRPPHPDLDAPHRARLEALAVTGRRDFDQAYLGAIRDEEAAQAALAAVYSRSGTNLPMRAYAARTEPILQAGAATTP